jgi:hypothetical protein
MTITIISTTAQLIAALNGAVTGDVIEMAPGTYSNVAISGKQFSPRPGVGASQVYIRSEFSNNTATLTDLDVENSKGLSFQDLNFSTASDPIGPLGAGSTRAININKSNNITLWDVNLKGSSSGTLASTISGLLITSSSSVNIEDSTFSYLHEAISQLNNNAVKILQNSFSHIYDDGISGGGTSNITISGNAFTDFHPDPTDTEHPDLIQFWTVNTKTSASNITINNNTYTRGTTNAVQGIFINDEVGTLPYSNVTIENNFLSGTLYNGIAVYDVHGGAIENNNLVSYSDYPAQLDAYGSKNVTVENNSAASYYFTGSSQLTILNNKITAPVKPLPDLGRVMDISSAGLTSPAPEPQTWTLFGAGLAILGVLRRRARRWSTTQSRTAKQCRNPLRFGGQRPPSTVGSLGCSEEG